MGMPDTCAFSQLARWCERKNEEAGRVCFLGLSITPDGPAVVVYSRRSGVRGSNPMLADSLDPADLNAAARKLGQRCGLFPREEAT